jgi:ATP-dependent RNA helicase RhlE
VINFELPNVPEQYVHRIGRTARAGLDGIALSFCAPDEKPFLKDIEKLTRMKIDPLALPENFLKEAARLPKPLPVTDERDRSDNARRSEVGSHKHAGRRFGGRGDDGVARSGRAAPGGRMGQRPDGRGGEGRSAASRDGERPYVGHRNAEGGSPEARGGDQDRAAHAHPHGRGHGRPEGGHHRPEGAGRPRGNRGGRGRGGGQGGGSGGPRANARG